MTQSTNKQQGGWDKTIDETALIQYGKKYIELRGSQRERAYNYYIKNKDNEEYKERLKANKQSYYQKHKDRIIKKKEPNMIIILNIMIKSERGLN